MELCLPLLSIEQILVRQLKGDVMYKVRYKVKNASESWKNHGSYGSETGALQAAVRIAPGKLMVQVLDPRGNTVWSA
jgi:hypothetical protein